jgi:hypothetical protein
VKVAWKLKKAGYHVKKVCGHLSLSRSRYYRHVRQKMPEVNLLKLRAKMHQIHAEHDASYGSRRMKAELKAQGITIGRYKVRRLMTCWQFKVNQKAHRYPMSGKPSVVALIYWTSNLTQGR